MRPALRLLHDIHEGRAKDLKDDRAPDRAIVGEQYAGSTPRGEFEITTSTKGAKDLLLPKNIVNQRNHIEGTFGTGKRIYGLDCIKACRSDTSFSWIAEIFFVMNLSLFLKSLGSSFLSFFVSPITRLVERSFRLLLGLELSTFRALRLFQ